MPSIRVALVEDNHQFLAELCTLLAEVPFIETVGSYTTGKAALTGIVRTCPDVALIDLGLPDFSGIELIWSLAERRCSTECLALTAYVDDAHLFAALEAGAVGYLVKDEASLATLVQVIQEAKDGGAPVSLASRGGCWAPSGHALSGPIPHTLQISPRVNERY